MNHLLPSVNFDSMTIEDNSDYNMVIQSTILQAVAPATPAPWHVQLVSPLLPIGTPPWLASAVTLFTLALTGFALYTLYQCYKTHQTKALTAALLAQIDEGAEPIQAPHPIQACQHKSTLPAPMPADFNPAGQPEFRRHVLL